jgi:hypothetical protein
VAVAEVAHQNTAREASFMLVHRISVPKLQFAAHEFQCSFSQHQRKSKQPSKKDCNNRGGVAKIWHIQDKDNGSSLGLRNKG